MTESARRRIVGLNHIALDVGDVEEALAFYGRLFKFELRGKERRDGIHRSGRSIHCPADGESADAGRHFGLVVDDKEAARRALRAAGVPPIDGHERRLRQHSVS
jgi:lactoylglutathione lyase